jgi:tetratricopeptide (TPR) repeat protein
MYNYVRCILKFDSKIEKNDVKLAKKYYKKAEKSNYAYKITKNKNYDINEVLKFYQYALEIYEKYPEKYKYEIICCYMGIGFLYQDTNFDKAIVTFEKLLQLCKYPENGKEILDTYRNIAEIYNQKGDCENSIFYYKKALEICEDTENIFNLIEDVFQLEDIYTEIANVYIALENYEQAIFYYNKLVELFKKSGEFEAAEEINKYISEIKCKYT